jgi:hypothetical protein
LFIFLRDGKKQKSAARRFFVGLNTHMIADVKFSGLFVPKPVSPTGNADGYYVGVVNKPMTPVTNCPVKL